MFAVVALVCGIVAAILKLVNQHQDAIQWLLIIGLVCLGIEAVWGWHRAGYYHR